MITGDKVGFFAYVALTTNLAAAAGAVSGAITAWIVLRKPDISMMLNGVLAALVAVTAASGFVAPWAAVVIGLVSGVIAVVGVLAVERIGIDDPIGAVAVHGVSGVWGTLATGLFAVPALAATLKTGQAASSTRARCTRSGCSCSAWPRSARSPSPPRSAASGR